MSRATRTVGRGLTVVGHLLAGSAFAGLTTNSYLNAGSMPWDSGVIGVWSAGAPAIGNAACVISNSGVKSVLIVDSTSAASMTVSNVLVSAPAGGNLNTLSVSTSNALTILQSLTIGFNGAMTVSNATVHDVGQAGGFIVDNGTLTLSGGLLSGSGTMSVGEGGTGTVWLTGGTLSNTNAGSYIAPNSGTTGSMTISNGLAIYRDLSVGILGSGALTMAGGTLQVDFGFAMANGLNATGSGVVNIQSTGGTWLGGGLTFGNSNPGTFTINGGTNIFSSLLTVGGSSGSGSVWVVSGKLIATNGTTTIANSAFGQFTATGGHGALALVPNPQKAPGSG